jgi:hypothetical protein
MSTYISARLGLTRDAPLPKCYMGGTESNIPVVEWAEGDFSVGLSNLNNPATYLREWAHRLNALAAEVDAARDQREPKGYDAPVGHVDERAAAEMHQ